jgi:hypothetical protein
MEENITNQNQSNIPDSKKENIINPNQFIYDEKNYWGTLMSQTLPNCINAVGAIYFFLSLIGGIYLITISFTSEERLIHNYLGPDIEHVPIINYFSLSWGIVGILSSLLVLFATMGMARIIRQNIQILENQKTDKSKT